MKLTDKELIELRIKCFQPFVEISSKNGLTTGEFLVCAEEAWLFAIKPLGESTDLKSK